MPNVVGTIPIARLACISRGRLRRQSACTESRRALAPVVSRPERHRVATRCGMALRWLASALAPQQKKSEFCCPGYRPQAARTAVTTAAAAAQTLGSAGSMPAWEAKLLGLVQSAVTGTRPRHLRTRKLHPRSYNNKFATCCNLVTLRSQPFPALLTPEHLLHHPLFLLFAAAESAINDPWRAHPPLIPDSSALE